MCRRLTWLFLLQISTALGAEPLQMRTDAPRFVGAISCKSSSCHGGAGEKRSQFLTWTQKDFHTRGYAILTNARSARIAQSLGIAAAPGSSRCTICHSPLQAVPASRLTSRADPRESVSCESCHGAAEPWLRGHTRTDWTYATRIGAGMRDLKSFYVRANTCVACHQNLDNDIAAAGHPELVFELDSQSVAEPKHWRDPEGSGVRAWLVGQAVALREVSWKLAQNPAANESTMAQWNALVWLLNKATAGEASLLPIDEGGAAGTDFAHMQQQADALARRAAGQNFSGDFARRLLRELAAAAPEFEETMRMPKELLFRRAQRLLLALERLAANEENSSAELTALRETLRSPAQFQPNEFSARLQKWHDRLSAAP